MCYRDREGITIGFSLGIEKGLNFLEWWRKFNQAGKLAITKLIPSRKKLVEDVNLLN